MVTCRLTSVILGQPSASRNSLPALQTVQTPSSIHQYAFLSSKHADLPLFIEGAPHAGTLGTV